MSILTTSRKRCKFGMNWMFAEHYRQNNYYTDLSSPLSGVEIVSSISFSLCKTIENMRRCGVLLVFIRVTCIHILSVAFILEGCVYVVGERNVIVGKHSWLWVPLIILSIVVHMLYKQLNVFVHMCYYYKVTPQSLRFMVNTIAPYISSSHCYHTFSDININVVQVN